MACVALRTAKLKRVSVARLPCTTSTPILHRGNAQIISRFSEGSRFQITFKPSPAVCPHREALRSPPSLPLSAVGGLAPPVRTLGSAQRQRGRRTEPFVSSLVGGCYLANMQDDTDSSCVGCRL